MILNRVHNKPLEGEQLKESSKKKKPVYISLIGTDDNVSYITLEEATKLSNRRGLKLMKITDFDVKKKCAVYKLLTSAQYLQDEIKHKKSTKDQPTGFKSEKIITFSNKISNHDLDFKVKQIIKWIEKYHQVRATVSGLEPNDQQTEKVYSQIETLIGKQARILQKRSSGVDIKFQIVPLKKEKKENENKETENSTQTS